MNTLSSRSIALPAIFVLIMIADASFGADVQRDVQERAQRIWNEIQSAEGTADPNQSEYRLKEYWAEVTQQCFATFDEVYSDPDYKEIVEFYCAQFGRHGAQADMRWLLADARLTMPFGIPAAPAFERPSGSRVSELQQKTCELLVRRFFEDPELLRRYYVAILWSGELIRDRPNQPHMFQIVVREVMRGLHERLREEYWGHARNFLLVLHGTGRDDLLRTGNPEDLKRQAVEFRDWFEKNRPYLRPDPAYPRWVLDEEAKENEDGRDELPRLIVFPTRPFPDWKGVAPPPRTAGGLPWI